MEMTDIEINSHVISDKVLTLEEIKELEQLLKKDETFENVIKFLEGKGHSVLHKHSNELEVLTVNSKALKEWGEDMNIIFNEAMVELNNMFKEEATQQPNNEPV